MILSVFLLGLGLGILIGYAITYEQQIKEERRMIDEEKCKCGMNIPKGFGYYNYGKQIKCFGCGRINYRKIQKKQIKEVKK